MATLLLAIISLSSIAAGSLYVHSWAHIYHPSRFLYFFHKSGARVYRVLPISMCIYTTYEFRCGHRASFRPNTTNRNRFLSNPCPRYPNERENCRAETENCVTVPINCYKCGGPRDPRFRGFPLVQAITLVWHVPEKKVRVTFRDVDWTAPRRG